MIPDSVIFSPLHQPLDAVVRTVIADDKRLARQKLLILLDSEPQVKVVAECQDGRQTVSAIRSLQPDMLLLDIQMPDLDGFQVLSEIPPEEMPVVIFTSAYDQYAIRAFEANALDYLLKPFDRKRVLKTIDKVKARIAERADPAADPKIDSRIDALIHKLEKERGQ